MSLYLFGGAVLHGFSFALVVGILIGTYSSIAVAAPMLVAYQDWRKSRGKISNLPAKRARHKWPDLQGRVSRSVCFCVICLGGSVSALQCSYGDWDCGCGRTMRRWRGNKVDRRGV